MKQISLTIWTILISIYLAYYMIGDSGYADIVQFPGLFEYLLVPVAVLAIGGMIVIEWRNHWRLKGAVWVRYLAIISIEAGAISWFLLLIHNVLLPWPIIIITVLAGAVFVLIREQSQ